MSDESHLVSSHSVTREADLSKSYLWKGNQKWKAINGFHSEQVF